MRRSKSSNSCIIALLLLVLFCFFIFSAAETRKAFACDPANSDTKHLPFCKTDLSAAKRAKDLIGRLTVQEKVKLLVNNAAAVPRLGIKGYEWWSEGLHGVSDVGPGTKFGGEFPGATSFPQVITTAASFNTSLWEEIGKVVSDEGRAMYNGGQAGLTYWSPNVNIFRDPRWGRGQETPGEDPVVVGKYAASYVKGLQGNNHNDRLKVAASCKHFTAYDLDNWNGVDRFHFNALVSVQDMEDTFNIPFRSCVREGKVASVMCSYNQVNGVPACADPKLLRKTIRGAWGLNGYIVSDCDSVGVFFNTQHYTSTPEEAAAAAIKAGLDLDCGPFLAIHTENAVAKKLLKEADVDAALTNTISVQMRLGMFDGELSSQPHGKLGPKDVCSASHQKLALQAARQGIVLLKNDGPVLPLSQQQLGSVAVIGPNSDATKTMIGNYAGVPCGYTSPLQGIGKYTRTIHNEGCDGVACDKDDLFSGAIKAASKADATILVMGLDQSIEAEFVDRVGLLLPGRQQDLVTKVASASKGPTILVLLSGGPVDVSFAQNDARIGAILWAGYPGQAGGAAIADVLFGAHNPGGRLPMTWYPEEYLNNLPMTTMDMRANPSKNYPGRTYRFYKGPVVYSYGHGLSYTSFKHTIAKAPKLLSVPMGGGHRDNSTTFSGKLVRVGHANCKSLTLKVHVEVENVGSRDGTHTLLMFASPPGGDWAPQKQLVGFQTMGIPSRGKHRVVMSVSVCKHLSVVDSGGVRRIPMGDHGLYIGDATHTVSLQPRTI
ncbi:putative beta-D-xylosidase 2 [Salvia divinorum]|uniref:Beta-D-xylosidase 2 n=1 Tax=Salvia divinorum TaxID=28513 RepID=A0ABD1H1J2_SALDI